MKLEVRTNEVIIDGYVNAVERFSKPIRSSIGTFIEKISQGAFKRALDSTDDVLVLLDHDYSRELASTKKGTAKLREDNIGLRATVRISDEEVIEKAKEGKLRGWSFGFVPISQDSVPKEGGTFERTVNDLELREVSIIDDRKTPSYNATSIEIRGDDEIQVEYRGFGFDEVEIVKEKPKIDYSRYDEVVNNLKEEN